MLHYDKVIEKKTFDLVKEGVYEAILNAEWRKDFDGEDVIHCAYKIRTDVEQEYKGRLVFDKIKKDKNGVYHPGKINSILASIPDSKGDFETYDELIQYINDALIRINVSILKANPDYPNSKDRNSIKYYLSETTKFPELKETAVIEKSESLNKIETDEDDLPF